MAIAAVSSSPAGPASLIVTDPSGHRSRLPLDPLPFRIGRAPESSLILRDSRVSRSHARITVEKGEYVVEDCGSLHGTYVNGKRVTRQTLRNSDKIEFGAQDSYQLVFALDGAELKRLMEQIGASEKSAPGVGGNLGKLRAILDLARTLQGSFSIDDVLASVVDTALAITGAERGFLLLRAGEELEPRVARDRQGQRLHHDDLRVPREVLHRALQHRRELLSMSFDPLGAADTQTSNTVINLELRSVICVPIDRPTEPVRFTAASTVFAMKDEQSVPALVAQLEEEESLRVKNRIAQGLSERGWPIPEELLQTCRNALPPDFGLSGDKVRRH